MAKNRTASEAELLIGLDRHAERPLHAQLEDLVRCAVRDGRLRPGTRLPASRSLARDLGVSRGVVVDVYAQLIAEGYLEARGGSATRVAELASAVVSDVHPAAVVDDIRYDFRPGVPDVGLFPRAAWATSLRRALQGAPDSIFGYGEARGMPVACTEVAAYLRRVRGVAAEPEWVVVCGGVAQGLNLLCAVLHERGIEELAVEEPSHPEQLTIITRAGLRVVPIAVDEDGIDVTLLAQSGARAVLVTPAHQFPLGVVLSPARRLALINWAREHDGLIFEDDYDAEYRYDRAPVGALQGLAPDYVIYAGSLSKMLAPALRLGWTVVPQRLLTSFVTAKRFADLGSPALDQLALADFIASGALDRHLRRVRASYRARRDVLADALRAAIPGSVVRGIAAGLHVVVELPHGSDEQRVVARAKAQGVRVYGLSGYYAQGRSAVPSLVLGYAALSEGAIVAGVDQLAAALRA